MHGASEPQLCLPVVCWLSLHALASSSGWLPLWFHGGFQQLLLTHFLSLVQMETDLLQSLAKKP